MSDLAVCDSNEALTLEVDGNEYSADTTFQIFEDEKIFGYKDPQVRISFSRDYTPLIEFKYTSESEGATEVVNTLKEWAPDAYTDRSEWEKLDAVHVPIGTKIAEIDQYEVHKATMADANDLFTKIKIFVILFIDGGSYIDQTDENWELYFVYDGNKIVGFCTVYPHFYYKDAVEFTEHPDAKRKRISQFLILPPYRRKGLGTKFLSVLFERMIQDKQVFSITVEDPSETFDILKDRVTLDIYKEDLAKLGDAAEEEQLKNIAKKYKTDFESVRSVYEIYVLSQHPEQPKSLRKLIKSRLWQKNYMELKQDPVEEQRDKLEYVYDNVIDSYNKVLGAEGTQEPAFKRLKLA